MSKMLDVTVRGIYQDVPKQYGISITQSFHCLLLKNIFMDVAHGVE